MIRDVFDPRTFLELPITSRTATHDQIGGTAMFEVRDDTGLYRIDSNGLAYRLWSLDRFSIHPVDPLAARGEVTFRSRGDWQVRTTSRTVLAAIATDFHIRATLDAWEGEQRLVARNWNVSVPRNVVQPARHTQRRLRLAVTRGAASLMRHPIPQVPNVKAPPPHAAR